MMERELATLAVSEFNQGPYCLALDTANAVVSGAISQANYTANIAQLGLDHLEVPGLSYSGASK